MDKSGRTEGLADLTLVGEVVGYSAQPSQAIPQPWLERLGTLAWGLAGLADLAVHVAGRKGWEAEICMVPDGEQPVAAAQSPVLPIRVLSKLHHVFSSLQPPVPPIPRVLSSPAVAQAGCFATPLLEEFATPPMEDRCDPEAHLLRDTEFVLGHVEPPPLS